MLSKIKKTISEKVGEVKVKILDYLNPVPEIKDEYVAKVVYLLRRDFPHQEQNEIILDIIDKLSYERDKDIIQMEKDFAILQDSNNRLKLFANKNI